LDRGSRGPTYTDPVSREDVKKLKIKIIDIEADKALQDAVMSVHDATRHLFSGTPTTKIIENHNGRAYIEMMQTIQVVQGPAPEQQGPQPIQPAQGPNRAQRRAQQRRR
jgi:hypothetical protein